MKNLLTAILITLSSTGLYAYDCANQHPHEPGTLNFLSNGIQLCEPPPPGRLEEVQSFIPDGMFKISSRDQKIVMDQFSTLPNSHIETLVGYFKHGVFREGISTGNPGPPGAIGVCHMRSVAGGQGFYPTKIILSDGQGGDAFMHELGHAMEDTLVEQVEKMKIKKVIK